MFSIHQQLQKFQQIQITFILNSVILNVKEQIDLNIVQKENQEKQLGISIFQQDIYQFMDQEEWEVIEVINYNHGDSIKITFKQLQLEIKSNQLVHMHSII